MHGTLAKVSLLLALAGGVEKARAQTEVSTQLWGNVILGFPKSESLHLELDLEPKAQVSGGEPWRNLDVTPLVEVYPADWLDLTAAATVGLTHQLDGLNSFELTPRIGARAHLFHKVWDKVRPERVPLSRLNLGILARLELRNFVYSGDAASRHEWRFRTRFEAKVALNQPGFSEDGTLYVIADLEGYVPLGDEIPERFATKLRVRVGLGFRIDYRARVEALYIRDDNRRSSAEGFEQNANIIDLRVKLFF